MADESEEVVPLAGGDVESDFEPSDELGAKPESCCKDHRRELVGAVVLMTVLGGLLACASALELLPGAGSANVPLVTTTCGTIEGVYQQIGGEGSGTKISAYLGIPFAQPPTGREGRWKPARPASCWEAGTTLKATKPGNSCVNWVPFFPGTNAQTQSEDCLNLNVFVPPSPTAAAAAAAAGANASSTEPLPVIVWIYGGSNNFGSTEAYGSVQNLAALSTQGAGSEDGGVIVVAFNYRCGASLPLSLSLRFLMVPPSVLALRSKQTGSVLLGTSQCMSSLQRIHATQLATTVRIVTPNPPAGWLALCSH